MLEFFAIFFIILRYIFCHNDLDLQPKITNFNRLRASSLSVLRTDIPLSLVSLSVYNHLLFLPSIKREDCFGLGESECHKRPSIISWDGIGLSQRKSILSLSPCNIEPPSNPIHILFYIPTLVLPSPNHTSQSNLCQKLKQEFF